MKFGYTDLWIVGPYYIDFDSHNQLRIVGPGNHLFFGLSGIDKEELSVKEVLLNRGRLVVDVELFKNELFLPDPIIRNIRRIRQVTEKAYEKRKNFQELANQYPDLEPNFIYAEETDKKKKITYRRRYSHHWYGATVEFPFNSKIERDEKKRGFKISSDKPLVLKIIAESDKLKRRRIKGVLPSPVIDLGVFDDKQELIRSILERTKKEVEHLITYDKTSGFEYGTIFPRDWMEAADLGVGDFSQSTIDYMYKQALKFVSSSGVGWHENIIGEYKEELLGQQIVRHMIDIEPRYLLGLRVVSDDFIEENKVKLQKVAKYVVKKASENEYIVFKKKPLKKRLNPSDIYWEAGNWRDSLSAFSCVKHPIAPYDVNAVYYPEALKMIYKFRDKLEIQKDLTDLISNWEKKEKNFFFQNQDGQIGYALALYGNRLEDKLKVNNLDEAFKFVYSSFNEEEAVSFALRIISPQYFYTPAGPTLVGAKSGYSTKDYHGEVIWIKQTAFAVLGMRKALNFGQQFGWSKESLKIIKDAIVLTSQKTISAVAQMQAVPELYIWDNKKNKAVFYDSQEGIEAQMSKVQLWSAVGIRQIITSYYNII
jgi:hypothetical protein